MRGGSASCGWAVPGRRAGCLGWQRGRWCGAAELGASGRGSWRLGGFPRASVVSTSKLQCRDGSSESSVCRTFPLPSHVSLRCQLAYRGEQLIYRGFWAGFRSRGGEACQAASEGGREAAGSQGQREQQQRGGAGGEAWGGAPTALGPEAPRAGPDGARFLPLCPPAPLRLFLCGCNPPPPLKNFTFNFILCIFIPFKTTPPVYLCSCLILSEDYF